MFNHSWGMPSLSGTAFWVWSDQSKHALALWHASIYEEVLMPQRREVEKSWRKM